MRSYGNINLKKSFFKNNLLSDLIKKHNVIIKSTSNHIILNETDNDFCNFCCTYEGVLFEYKNDVSFKFLYYPNEYKIWLISDNGNLDDKKVINLNDINSTKELLEKLITLKMFN